MEYTGSLLVEALYKPVSRREALKLLGKGLSGLALASWPSDVLAGSLDDKIRELERAAIKEKDPKKAAELWVELGREYYKRDDFEKFGVAAQQAVKNDPESSAAHNQLGLWYLGSRNDLSRAEQKFRLALQFNSENYEAWNNLGAIYIRRRNYDEAEKYIREALAVNLNYYMAHYNLALIHYHRGNYNDSLKELNVVLKLKPNYKLAQMSRKNLLFEMSK